jgi:hypothetical protein
MFDILFEAEAASVDGPAGVTAAATAGAATHVKLVLVNPY